MGNQLDSLYRALYVFWLSRVLCIRILVDFSVFFLPKLICAAQDDPVVETCAAGAIL